MYLRNGQKKEADYECATQNDSVRVDEERVADGGGEVVVAAIVRGGLLVEEVVLLSSVDDGEFVLLFYHTCSLLTTQQAASPPRKAASDVRRVQYIDEVVVHMLNAMSLPNQRPLLTVNY